MKGFPPVQYGSTSCLPKKLSGLLFVKVSAKSSIYNSGKKVRLLTCMVIAVHIENPLKIKMFQKLEGIC